MSTNKKFDYHSQLLATANASAMNNPVHMTNDPVRTTAIELRIPFPFTVVEDKLILTIPEGLVQFDVTEATWEYMEKMLGEEAAEKFLIATRNRLNTRIIMSEIEKENS